MVLENMLDVIERAIDSCERAMAEASTDEWEHLSHVLKCLGGAKGRLRRNIAGTPEYLRDRQEWQALLRDATEGRR
jgi:hypothetical protein